MRTAASLRNVLVTEDASNETSNKSTEVVDADNATLAGRLRYCCYIAL